MAGQYCPEGSANGTYCPPGTYLDTTGGRQESDCLPCTQGYYCDGYGNDNPTGQCSAGYYCPTGMNVSTPAEYTCPEGERCCVCMYVGGGLGVGGGCVCVCVWGG